MKRIKMLSVILSVFVLLLVLSSFALAAELSGDMLTIVDFSSDHPSDTGDDDYRISFAVDGDIDTFWNNEWDPLAPPPHHIILDLGAVYTITGFKYLPRQDGYGGEENGNLGPYEIYLSSDNSSFTMVTSGSFDDKSMTWSTAEFDGSTARYFKLVKPTGDYIDVAELVILVQETAVTPPAPSTGDNNVLVFAIIALLMLGSVITISRKKAACR